MTDLTPIRAVKPALKTQLIPLNKLIISKLNVRKHGPKDVDTLAASIAAKGLLQPLLVRPSGKSFEVIFGQRRTLALKKLNAAHHPDTDQVPCVVSDMSDAAAIAASLAENIERLPMDVMDQFEAFANLAKAGQDQAAIASHFGVTPQTVKRRLAIARLIPDVRKLYRDGAIADKDLQLLTLAPKQRQKEYAALVNDPKGNPPPAWQLKAWLLGGSEIATKAALFPLETYKAPIAADLFGQEKYFTDPDEFWKLQNAAVAERKAGLEASGWTVELFDPERTFHEWQYEKRARDKGGRAIIAVAANGTVAIHKGLIHRDEPARMRSRRKGKKPGESEDVIAENTATAPERAELTEPLSNYIELVRHAAVRAALTQAPQTALRVAVAQLIAGSTHWRIMPEPRRPDNAAIAEATAKLAADETFRGAQTAAHSLIGNNAADADAPEDGRIVSPHGYDTGRTVTVYQRLTELGDDDVLKLLTVAVAETLAMGTGLVDALGGDLRVDALKDWQPDDTLFALIRDQDTLSAMLAEVAGEQTAGTHLTATGARKKEIIRNALAGKNRPKKEGWKPRWMAFPQGQYTKRPLTARGKAGA